MLVLVPTSVFWISKPISSFGQIWTKKLKVVQVGWKLVHRASRRRWFLFWQYFSQFQTLNAFWTNLTRKIQSCSFWLKIGTRGISRMLIFIPKTVFWIANPKSIFGQIWAENVKAVYFAWNLARSHIHTQYLENVDSYFDISFLKFQIWILRMLILILRLVFWITKPKSSFWTNLSRKTWILYFVWKLVHRVPWGCDCKNTE